MILAFAAVATLSMNVPICLPNVCLVVQFALLIHSLLFSLSLSADASRGSTTRIGGAVAEFHFLRSECTQGSFRDHSNYDLLGGLVLDPTHTACLRGNGVTSQPLSPWGGAPVRSASPIRNLITSAQRSELSIEMWLRSNSSVALETSILSFSHISSVSDFALRIDQTGASSSFPDGLRMRTRNSQGSTIVADTQRVPIRRYFHIVFDIKYVMQNYFNTRFYGLHENVTLNATLLQQFFDMSTSGSFDASLWNPDYALHLFTSQQQQQTQAQQGAENYWPGEVLLLAIYNHTLSLTDIDRNFKAGLPNSLPVVWSVKIRVFEDGQSPSDLSVYSSSEFIPVDDLGVIELPCFDVDDTEGHPNFVLNNGSFVSYATCYISSLPSAGVLYALRPHDRKQPVSAGLTAVFNASEITSGDWEEVTSVPWPVFIGAIDAGTLREPLGSYQSSSSSAPTLLKGYFAKYRPARNEYSAGNSVFDRFQVEASDYSTAIRGDSAEVQVFVDSINDPPDAARGLSADVFANVSAVLSISGADVDGAVVSAIVSRLPRLGALYDVYPNGTLSKRRIQTLPFPLSSMNVAYRYEGLQNLTSNDMVNTDEFEFAVTDDRSLVSSSQVYRLIVRSSIVVINNASVTTGFEASDISVPLVARDMSSSNRLLFAQIGSLPRHGVLVDPSTGLTLRVSDTMYSPMRYGKSFASINVSYIGDPYFFSLPRVRVNGSIIMSSEKDKFTVIYRSADEAVSKPATLYVNIVNRNHPTNLSFSYPNPWSERGMFDIYTISADNGSGNHQTRAIVNGFALVDPDKDSNVVRLRITTSGGRVSLNEKFLEGIIFNSAAYCYQSEWRCRGDGVDDLEISAVGSPQDVYNAIEGMTFRSALEKYVDVVNVTVFDGVGGQCVSSKSVDAYTLQSGCSESTVSFQVNVKAVEDGYYSDKSNVLFGNFISMELIVMILVCTVLILCCYNMYACYKKRVKKFINSDPLDAVLAQQQSYQQHYCASCNSRSDAIVLVEENEVDRAVRVGIILGDSGSDSNNSSENGTCLPCEQTRAAAEVP